MCQNHRIATFTKRGRRKSFNGNICSMYYAALRLITLITLCALFPYAALSKPDFTDDGKLLTAEYPDWFLDTFLDLEDDLKNARESGKKGLIVVFSTAGCSYCYKFADETLRDAEVVANLRRDFDAVALEIFSDDPAVTPWGEELPVKEFAKKIRADYTPAVYFFDLSGKPQLRIIGFTPPDRLLSAMRYVAGEHYYDGSFREFLAAERRASGEIAQVEKIDDSIFSDPPFMLARNHVSGDRPLMVVFDGPDCQECPYLFGTLFKDPKLREQLLQMEVVRLRIDEKAPVVTPAGERTTTSDWHGELGFHRTPAFAFFDPSGNLVMQSDALMLRQRLDNTLGYVLEEAYLEGISYQRFARRRALSRMQQQ